MQISLSNQLNTQEQNDVETAINDFNQKLSGCITIRQESSQTQYYFVKNYNSNSTNPSIYKEKQMAKIEIG